MAQTGLGVRAHRDDGFTLIELLIVCTILPILVGAISLALISVFTLQSGVSNRLADAADAQAVSSTYEKDVQSAANLTTSTAGASTGTQCGPGIQLLGLQSIYNQQTKTYQTVISYVKVQTGSTWSLVRQVCASGASTTPTSSSTVSSDIPAGQGPATVLPIGSNEASGWIPGFGVTGVTIAITEPGSQYTYTLVALPAANSSSNQPATALSPTTGCGFATRGTGTYVTSLCFVDFTGYDVTKAQAPGCQPMSAAISGTPFKMTFCLQVSADSGPVSPHSIPTYSDDVSHISQAFLGNNGFYTGIPGNPALYQTAGNTTTTVVITGIQLLNSDNQPAKNWQLVTGDAESTDVTEWIDWHSDANLSLLPNSGPSPYGNACASSAGGPANLAVLNTADVRCAAGVSSNKTGTVMLEASIPRSLTVQMHGGGLQAFFLGVLLT